LRLHYHQKQIEKEISIANPLNKKSLESLCGIFDTRNKKYFARGIQSLFLFKIKKSSFGSQALGLNFKSHDPQ
jgi:hypothetical protein